jgi:hypothetical protein
MADELLPVFFPMPFIRQRFGKMDIGVVMVIGSMQSVVFPDIPCVLGFQEEFLVKPSTENPYRLQSGSVCLKAANCRSKAVSVDRV